MNLRRPTHIDLLVEYPLKLNELLREGGPQHIKTIGYDKV